MKLNKNLKVGYFSTKPLILDTTRILMVLKESFKSSIHKVISVTGPMDQLILSQYAPKKVLGLIYLEPTVLLARALALQLTAEP